MVKSKEWNWAVVENNIWNIPSEDIYFYIDRWSSLNFKSFLDIGCGLGRHSLLFASNGFDTSSIDLSKYALDELNIMSNFEIIKIRHIEDIFENTSSWHYFIHGKKK